MNKPINQTQMTIDTESMTNLSRSVQVGKYSLVKIGTPLESEPMNRCIYHQSNGREPAASEPDMSKKEDKKDEKKDDKKGGKEPASPEQEAAAGKKKKLIMFAVIGLLVVGGGAFAAMKMLGGSSKAKNEVPAADKPAEGGAEGHADSKEGEAKGEHGEAKPEEHGGGHGDAKKDEAKKDAHGKEGEAKKDAHGKEGDAKKDEHGGGEKGKEGEKGAEAPAAPERYSGIGLMHDMKPFHLNLGNPLENRYVRMEIRLEFPNEEQRPELQARDSQLRDAIVSIVSRKTREHLLSPDGKDQLRLEIKNRVNQYLDKKITNVFITDILIE